MTIGFPALFFIILISLKETKEPIPVPRAFDIASFAANLPDKVSINLFWDLALTTSSLLKSLLVNFVPHFK